MFVPGKCYLRKEFEMVVRVCDKETWATNDKGEAVVRCDVLWASARATGPIVWTTSEPFFSLYTEITEEEALTFMLSERRNY